MISEHAWKTIPPGDAGKSPQRVNAIIEIPKGSKCKYEIDKDYGLLRLDRVLFSSVMYPANYGFIPMTYCDDNDPLDILVICSQEVVPMCILEAKVIGVMHMVDKGERDDKIIAVAANDMSVNYINDITDLPPHTEAEITRFFEDYKKLEHSASVTVEQFEGREEAYRIIEESIALYKSTFQKENI
ncbi:MAG: inorganic diphosphatase [Sphingobacteriaceae bacterium]|nr:MAG: inorganic diphosphatase [Sphingobacteriaceae bacterium]